MDEQGAEQLQLPGTEDEAPAWEEEEGTDRGDLAWKPRKVEYPDYDPLANLLAKHDAWLMQQPEWAIILAAPRTTRRKAITMLAKQMSTIPQRYKFK